MARMQAQRQEAARRHKQEMARQQREQELQRQTRLAEEARVRMELAARLARYTGGGGAGVFRRIGQWW